jgi:hypothetical protein
MLPASILGFFPSAFRRRPIRNRLKALRMASVAPSRWQTAVGVSLVLLLAVGGLTDARDAQEPMDLASWMSQNPDVEAQLKARQQSYIKQPISTGPLIRRTYDIQKVLRRIAHTEPATPNGAQMILGSFVKHIFQATNGLQERSSSDNKSPETSTPAASESSTKSATPSQMSYSISGNTLTVDAPAALHEQLARMLDAWAESGMSQIAVSSRFVRSRHDLVSELGLSYQSFEALSPELPNRMFAPGRDNGPVVRAESRVDVYQPVVVTTLDSERMARLIEIEQRDSHMNMLNAPTVTLFNGQDCMIADCAQRPFVVGVTQSTPPGANQPKIVVIDEGSRIKLRCTQLGDLNKLHLQGNFEFSAVGDVSTATMKLNGGPVTIQIPRVSRNTLEVASDIENGHTLLVGFLPTDSKSEYLYFLLTPKIIREPNYVNSLMPKILRESASTQNSQTQY